MRIKDNIHGTLSIVPNTWQQIVVSFVKCHKASLVCSVLVVLNKRESQLG